MGQLRWTVLLCLAVAALSGCPRPGGQEPDAGTCLVGEQGCGCREGSSCNAGLVCTAGTCQPCTPDTPGCGVSCEPGTESCACGPNSTCGAGLVCEGGHCTRAVTCVAGAQDCLCGQGSTCDTGLVCTDGVCRACTSSTCPPPPGDGGTGSTRVTCATLPAPCGAGQTCIEATETADAYCKTVDNGCPPCSGEGVVEGQGIRTASGSCICQTQPGYFYTESGSKGAVPCDADGDGWVRDAARFYINHTDPVLRENARCALRVVDQFVLHNDQAQVLRVGLSSPLPLYETVRNDDAFILGGVTGTTQLPLYGATRALRANELNSLTKACVGDRADHNDNKVSDVAEWGRPALQEAGPPAAATMDDYVRLYTRFSYFVELHRGWFEPGPAGSPGRYHIAEKDRTLATGGNFPLRYGADPVTGVQDSDYWQDCRRARDVWYADAKPPITLDFASVSGPDRFWKGMTHHSQFKCVQVVDDTKYATTDKELNRHVQTVTSLRAPQYPAPVSSCTAGAVNCPCRTSGSACDNGLECAAVDGVCRIPRASYLRATVNLCSASADAGAVIGGAPNPSDPLITCSPAAPSQEHTGKTLWAAVRITESSEYYRGCILQCPGHPFICPGGDGMSCYAACGDLAASPPMTLTHAESSTSLRGTVPVLPATGEVLGNPDAGFSVHTH